MFNRLSFSWRGFFSRSSKQGLLRTRAPRKAAFLPTLHVLGLILCPSAAASAAEATPAPEAKAALSLTPETVTIETGAPQTVVVTTSDTGPTPTLQIFDPLGVHSSVVREPDAQSPVRPLSWLVRLATDPALSTESLVTFELMRDGQAFEIGQVKVVPKAGPTVAASVQADLLFDGEALLDGRQSTAFLQLTNLTDYDLAVSPPTPSVPAEITITPDIKGPVTLPAHSVLPVKLIVSITEGKTLTSGKHTIELIVPVARMSGGAPWKGEVSVSKEITAGIPGMTELQTALQFRLFCCCPVFSSSSVTLRSETWEGRSQRVKTRFRASPSLGRHGSGSRR